MNKNENPLTLISKSLTGTLIMIILCMSLLPGCSNIGGVFSNESSSSSIDEQSTNKSASSKVDNTSKENAKPSGIVAMKIEGKTNAISFSGLLSVELALIDPQSGNSKAWKKFNKVGNAYIRLYGQTAFLERRSFSPDYGRVVANEEMGSDGAWHVGWITSEGKYVDVSKEITQKQSDFANAIYHVEPKFGADGMFYYIDVNTNKIMKVDPDNLGKGSIEVCGISVNPRNAPFEEHYLLSPNGTIIENGHGMIKIENIKKGYYSAGYVSDWMDADTLLFDDRSDDEWQICTATPWNKEHSDLGHGSNPQSLLPNNHRKNWNPIASPDGQQVAFLSHTKDGSESAKLFLVSRNGGDPVDTKSDYSFLRISTPSDNNVLFASIQLLDWI